jgi:hypothetical protein
VRLFPGEISTVSGLFESAKAKACADVVELEGLVLVVVELEELDVLAVEELEELAVEEDIAVLVVDMLEDAEVVGDAGEANK